MSADDAKGLMDTGAKMERAAHGPAHDHGRYTAINVIIGEHKYPGEGEEEEDEQPPLLEGGKPKVN